MLERPTRTYSTVMLSQLAQLFANFNTAIAQSAEMRYEDAFQIR